MKPTPAGPKRDQDRLGQAQDLAAFKTDIATMMKDMIKSTLTEFWIMPKCNPPQLQSQFTPTPQVMDSSEGKISDSEQEAPE